MADNKVSFISYFITCSSDEIYFTLCRPMLSKDMRVWWSFLQVGQWGISHTCHGCRSVCYFLMGFWLKSVQSLPGSCHHTMHALPGWWFHEPPQQTGLPWQQLGVSALLLTVNTKTRTIKYVL